MESQIFAHRNSITKIRKMDKSAYLVVNRSFRCFYELELLETISADYCIIFYITSAIKMTYPVHLGPGLSGH